MNREQARHKEREEVMKRDSTIPYADFKAGELTPWQDLSRGLKTLESSVASLAVHVDNSLRALEQKTAKLQHDANMNMDMLATANRQRIDRDEQLTATIEGVDAHLETVEQSQQTYDEQIAGLENKMNTLQVAWQLEHESIQELHTTFQASIDKLDAKFDEYMQYVRNTSHTTISQGTRIVQLETITGRQRTMIETALRGLRDLQRGESHVSEVSE